MLTFFHNLSLSQLREGLELAPVRTLFPEAQQRENWLRAARSSRLAGLWQSIKDEADDAVGPVTELPFSRLLEFGVSGERRAYEEAYFTRRRRLAACAVLCLTEGGSERLAMLQDLLWAICNEYSWCLPAHLGLNRKSYPDGIWDQATPPRETVDLAAGETAFALAEITALLESGLHPWVVHRVRSEIRRRVLQVYAEDPSPQNWEFKSNNWPSVCAGCIGAATLYVEDDPGRLLGMLWKVLQPMNRYLGGFGPDGATPEGVAYWQYGFSYFVYFAELLRNRTGGRIDLLQSNHVKRIAAFPAACTLSGGHVINFSDCPPRLDWMSGLLSRLELRVGSDSLTEYGEYAPNTAVHQWSHTSRDLLWSTFLENDARSRQTALAPDPASDSTQHWFFPSVQWAVSKYRRNGRFIAVAAKGGHNGEPHNHNDLGQLLLHVDGTGIVADLGRGPYTKAYFHTDRYQHLHAGSHGHSVPVILGAHQQAGARHEADVLHYEESKAQVRYALDLTKAYELEELVRFHRSLAWGEHDRGLYLDVMDDLALQRPGPVIEAFFTSIKPLPQEPGGVRLGATTMAYDHRQWDFRVEELRNGQSPVWRILLTPRNECDAYRCFIRFLVDI